ncbi:MAG: class I SAM-dependent methyltransferase [Nitrospinaceae bacterium]|jgi:ubiquinone/menaquinone biosynthesis C-methylase UbiE|nr:class I SAM-dependent methyltransferase [Nitrospinaceae bacterium]
MRYFDINYPHSSAKRVVARGNRTLKNQIVAWGLSKEYYDGDRANGYGGFKYDGRWAKIMPTLLEEYGLTEGSSVLDIGCKKGFFLHDLKNAIPGAKVRGIENHSYPIECAMEDVKEDIILSPYQDLPFQDGEFDFILAFASIYMLSLGDIIKTLKEIQRVGKGKSYITLGAYRSPEQKELFLDWTLLGTTVLHEDEWIEILEYTGYTGDYYFTSAETLHLSRD